MSRANPSTKPSDKALVMAFDRGRERGRHQARHYREQCPYGESRELMRDAWLAGYDFGFEEGPSA